MSELDDCVSKGLIRKISPSGENAARSMAKAKTWLAEAVKNREFKLYDSCVVSAYSAMFHAARSLLFRDGYREKSHYCLARYVETTYVDAGKLERAIIDLLDRFKDLRHEELYDLDYFALEKDADEAIKNAGKVISAIEKLL